MIDHPTTDVSADIDSVTAIVFVGPPACGKSTMRSLLSSYGIPSCDVADSNSAGEVIDQKWADLIKDAGIGAADSKPKLCCIEGIIDSHQLNWIQDLFGDVLTIRVDVSDHSQRLDRYVERELEHQNSDSSVVSDDTIASLRSKAERRETLESPYPQHDVRIVNDEDVRTTELADRCVNIVNAVSSTNYDALSVSDEE